MSNSVVPQSGKHILGVVSVIKHQVCNRCQWEKLGADSSAEINNQFYLMNKFFFFFFSHFREKSKEEELNALCTFCLKYSMLNPS